MKIAVLSLPKSPILVFNYQALVDFVREHIGYILVIISFCSVLISVCLASEYRHSAQYEIGRCYGRLR